MLPELFNNANNSSVYDIVYTIARACVCVKKVLHIFVTIANQLAETSSRQNNPQTFCLIVLILQVK